MATSGSYDFSLTSAQLVAAAYEDLGVIVPGQTVSTANSAMALRRLNLIAKQYQGRADGAPGMPIHTRNRITLLLAKGQQTYLIGPAVTDARATALLGRTTVGTVYASGTSLIVAAITDATSYPGTTISMTTGDFIGLEQDDGTIGWTTLNGTPGSTTVTLTAGLSAAAVGNYVWWFTARAQRFPHIESAVLRSESFSDSPIDIYVDAQQYDQGVANKHADGTPTAILVEPLRTQTRITLDSQPLDLTNTLVITVLYPSEDYDATTDDIAYPQEALAFLSWELAFRLAPSVGRWTPEMEKNRTEARAMYLSLNPENSVLYFQPGGN